MNNTNKNDITNVLKKVKFFCKKSGFNNATLNRTFARGKKS